MPNPHRGEVELALGGRRFTLCLTLGALAELEHAFGVEDLGALGRRLSQGRLAARDLGRILAVAIRGGGTPLADADVAALPLDGGLAPVMEALAQLFEATFGLADPPDHGSDAPPAPARP